MPYQIPPNITPDQAIAAVLQLREYKASIAERHKVEMAPAAEALEAVTNWLLGYLNSNGLQNVNAHGATAYKIHEFGASVENWEAFLGAFVLKPALLRTLNAIEMGQPAEEAALSFITAPEFQYLIQGVNKTKVKEYMETTHGAIPPGVKTNQIIKVGVKKT